MLAEGGIDAQNVLAAKPDHQGYFDEDGEGADQKICGRRGELTAKKSWLMQGSDYQTLWHKMGNRLNLRLISADGALAIKNFLMGTGRVVTTKNILADGACLPS